MNGDDEKGNSWLLQVVFEKRAMEIYCALQMLALAASRLRRIGWSKAHYGPTADQAATTVKLVSPLLC